MSRETIKQKDSRLEAYRIAYLAGDNRAGNAILNQYDSLIKHTVLDYFNQRLDYQLGWSIEDVIQLARMRILQALKHFDINRCTYPYFITSTTTWACNRFIRLSTSQKRDHRLETDIDEVAIFEIVDNTAPEPYQRALENELINAIEIEVNQLNEVCRALWEVAKAGKESLYNSTHPLLIHRGGSSTLNHIKRLRIAVRKALIEYENDYQAI